MAKEQKKSVATAPITVQAGQAKSKATVTVALNRATGIQFLMPDGRRVVINGNAVDLRGREKGVLPVGAFGLVSDGQPTFRLYAARIVSRLARGHAPLNPAKPKGRESGEARQTRP